MTPIKMQIKLLKLAKLILRDTDRTSFICNALEYVTKDMKLPYIKQMEWMQEVYKLRNWIMRSLDGDHSYKCWLNRVHPNFQRASLYDYRVGRIQWIDWMINELKTNGKLP